MKIQSSPFTSKLGQIGQIGNAVPNVIQSIHLHRHRLSYQFQPLKSCSMKARTLSPPTKKGQKKALKRPAATNTALYYIQTEKNYLQPAIFIRKKIEKKVVENLHSFHSFIRKALRCMVQTLTYVTKVWCCHKNRKKAKSEL